jgi:4-carboxymuconolactone decarboxylase
MTGADKGERFDRGMATRRSVLGDAHVDGANAAMTPFDEPFQTFITEGAWGSVWSRPHLTKRERSMITLALLAALEDIREALLHVAVYAGVPAANHAFKIVKRTYAEMAAGDAKK